MPPVRPTIYDAWQSTLAPFLVPACVLSAWPVFMIVFAADKVPLKLLGMLALVSLADGLLGSAAYPLLHQYAFTPAQNNKLFYGGSVCYWLSGLVLGPVMDVWGTRKAVLVMSAVGAVSAVFSAQFAFSLAFLGRCGSATAAAALTTLVEHALYEEARLRPSTGSSRGTAALAPASSEEHLDKERGAQEPTHGLGGGMLTIYHQLRPLTLWASMWLGHYTMRWNMHISTGPCYAAAMCYAAVVLIALRLLPSWTASEALKATNKLRDFTNRAASADVQRFVPVFAASYCTSNSPVVQRWAAYFVGSYAAALRTLLLPAQLARHLVDVGFGALFFVLCLVWVPTLEMYDDSIPFGFIFQIFMMARFLGSSFALPVWAVGWGEAALVALLSVAARVLNTSRDYAIPVTIMVGGVAMHFVAGVTQVTGSLWRAEYPSAATPLTFLFLLKALTGLVGWLFLNVIDGLYIEDVFVFEARWVYALMWVEAVALAQYIARRATQHRDATRVAAMPGVTPPSALALNGVSHPSRVFGASSIKEDHFVSDSPQMVSVDADTPSQFMAGSSTTVSEHRPFRSP